MVGLIATSGNFLSIPSSEDSSHPDLASLPTSPPLRAHRHAQHGGSTTWGNSGEPWDSWGAGPGIDWIGEGGVHYNQSLSFYVKRTCAEHGASQALRNPTAVPDTCCRRKVTSYPDLPPTTWQWRRLAMSETHVRQRRKNWTETWRVTPSLLSPLDELIESSNCHEAQGNYHLVLRPEVLFCLVEPRLVMRRFY